MRTKRTSPSEAFSTPITEHELAQIFPALLEALNISEQEGPTGLFNFNIVPTHAFDEPGRLEKLAAFFSIEPPKDEEAAKEQQEFMDMFSEVRGFFNYTDNNYNIFFGQEPVEANAKLALSQISGFDEASIFPVYVSHLPQNHAQQIANFMFLLRISHMTVCNIQADGTPIQGGITLGPDDQSNYQARSIKAAEKVWIDMGGRADVLQQIRSAFLISGVTSGFDNGYLGFCLGALSLDDAMQFEHARRRTLFAVAGGDMNDVAAMPRDIAAGALNSSVASQGSQHMFNVLACTTPETFKDPVRIWDGISRQLNKLIEQRLGGDMQTHEADILDAEWRTMRDPSQRLETTAKIKNGIVDLVLLNRFANAMMVLNPEITRVDANAQNAQTHQYLNAYRKMVAVAKAKGLASGPKRPEAAAVVVGVGALSPAALAAYFETLGPSKGLAN